MASGVQHMINFNRKAFFRIAALATAGIAVSGCTYDVGLGYASDNYYNDGYYNDGYNCDPYGGYDNYYQCDYGQGFIDIGYGGGWYDSFWYPGYGFYLFDNIGRRYPMRDHHRRYWGERRHYWYRENRGRNHDGRHHDRPRHQGRRHDHNNNAAPGTTGWPERNGGRVHDGDDDRRGRDEGRRGRNGQWPGGDNRGGDNRGGDGQGAVKVPAPNPDATQRPGRGRQRDEGYGRIPVNPRNDDGANALPPRQQRERGERGERPRNRIDPGRGPDQVRPPRQPLPQSAPAITNPSGPSVQRDVAPRRERKTPVLKNWKNDDILRDE